MQLAKTLEPCILGCSTSKLARQMTMITHFIFTEFLITDDTKCGVIINQFIMHCHYHIFWELKLFINFSDVLFKCVYKYLRNIIIVELFYKLVIENRVYRQNTLCGNKIRWGCVSITNWCSSSQGFVGRLIAVVWRTREGIKICIYNKWDSHWPIVIFKSYFRTLFGKFKFYNFVWFTILMRRCYLFFGIESIKTTKAHMTKMTMFWCL